MLFVTFAKYFSIFILTKSLFFVTLFEKSNSCPKIQFWSNPNIFTKIFFGNFFSWNQSCQQLKSPKPQHFHEFFTPQKSTIFLGNQRLNFWTKKEDFEQCGLRNVWTTCWANPRDTARHIFLNQLKINHKCLWASMTLTPNKSFYLGWLSCDYWNSSFCWPRTGLMVFS